MCTSDDGFRDALKDLLSINLNGDGVKREIVNKIKLIN
jgi:hypothetical protein